MYKELFKTWENEKIRANLQEVPLDFYANLMLYLKEIRKNRRMLDIKTTKGILSEREEENVRKMTIELVQTRFKKIIQNIFLGRQTLSKDVAKEEEEFYNKFLILYNSFTLFKRNILERGVFEKDQDRKPEDLTVVRFLKDTPKIEGADGKTYGPFQSKDIAAIPNGNAIILSEEGLTMKVNT